MTDCDEHIRTDCASRLSRIETLLARVDQAVNGNGREGLLARVVRLEQLHCGQSRRADRFWKIFAVIVAVSSVIVAVVK